MTREEQEEPKQGERKSCGATPHLLREAAETAAAAQCQREHPNAHAPRAVQCGRRRAAQGGAGCVLWNNAVGFWAGFPLEFVVLG